MLAHVTLSDAPGAADLLLGDIAATLAAEGLRLAGAVQTNHERGADCSCDMDLTVLGCDGAPVRISQSLGSGSQGCRLDSGALAVAGGAALSALAGALLQPGSGATPLLAIMCASALGGLLAITWVLRRERQLALQG